MHDRLVEASNVWPSVNWQTVWTLPYDVWRAYAGSLDQIREQARTAAPKGGR